MAEEEEGKKNVEVPNGEINGGTDDNIEEEATIEEVAEVINFIDTNYVFYVTSGLHINDTVIQYCNLQILAIIFLCSAVKVWYNHLLDSIG